MTGNSKHRVLLLLGSNLGDRVAHLKAALDAIQSGVGSIVKTSSIYETAPWGVTNQPNYLNAAMEILTPLDPFSLLSSLKKIEINEGRTDRKKYASRTLDIDILFYDGITMDSNDLTIPHPKLHLRKFALVPLSEIAADHIHPVLNKSVGELLSTCGDQLGVHHYGQLNK